MTGGSNRSRWGRWVTFALVAGSLGGAGRAADPPAVFGEFLHVRPQAPMVEAARAAGYVFNGRAFRVFDAAQTQLQPGDQVVAVIELRGKGESQQWLLGMRRTEEEARSDQPAGKDTEAVARVFTSTGRSFRFPADKVGIEVEVFGPLELSKRGAAKVRKEGVKRQQAQLQVRRGFLEHGFASFAAAWIDGVKRNEGAGPSLGLQFRPFDEAYAAEVAKVATQLGWSEEDDRAFAGTLPALLEFLTTILQTPSMAEVFWEITDVPWFAVLKRKGKIPEIGFTTDFRGLNQIDFGPKAPLDFAAVYRLPYALKLAGKEALDVSLIVRKPVGALALTAGVIGIEARDPRDATKRAMVRLVGVSSSEIRADGAEVDR